MKTNKVLFITDAPDFPTGVAHQLYNIIESGFSAEDKVVVLHPPRSPRAGEVTTTRIGNTIVKKINSPKGYADDAGFTMKVIEEESPDAIVIFTDPWAYVPFISQMSFWLVERNIPLIYYHVWDNFPAPIYNLPFYFTSNIVVGISVKSTINVLLSLDYVKEYNLKTYRNPDVFYLPHAVDDNLFKKRDRKTSREFLNQVTKGFVKDDDFVFLINNRNISRKNLMDTIYTFMCFATRHDNVKLVIKTDAVVPVGTDIPAFLSDMFFFFEKRNLGFVRDKICFINNDEIFNAGGFTREEIALLYNACDATLQLSSNEGFGIASLESTLCGTPVVATHTGGIADQYSIFSKNYSCIKNADYEDPIRDLYNNIHDSVVSDYAERVQKYKNIDFSKDRNHLMIMVYPSRHFQGSPATPYILDDRVSMGDMILAFEKAMSFKNQDNFDKLYEDSRAYITTFFDKNILGKEFKKAVVKAIKNNETQNVLVI